MTAPRADRINNMHFAGTIATRVAIAQLTHLLNWAVEEVGQAGTDDYRDRWAAERDAAHRYLEIIS